MPEKHGSSHGMQRWPTSSRQLHNNESMRACFVFRRASAVIAVFALTWEFPEQLPLFCESLEAAQRTADDVPLPLTGSNFREAACLKEGAELSGGVRQGCANALDVPSAQLDREGRGTTPT